MKRYRGCCAKLDAVVLEESHRHERLLRCQCGQHWSDRFHEDVDWRDGNDRMYSWLTPITPEDAAGL